MMFLILVDQILKFAVSLTLSAYLVAELIVLGEFLLKPFILEMFNIGKCMIVLIPRINLGPLNTWMYQLLDQER